MNGTITSCGCALCQSQMPRAPAMTGWLSPPNPVSRVPSVAALMKARVLALIQAEIDALPPVFMRDLKGPSPVLQALLRLAGAVEEMTTTS